MYHQSDLEWMERGCLFGVAAVIGVALLIGWAVGYFIR